MIGMFNEEKCGCILIYYDNVLKYFEPLIHLLFFFSKLPKKIFIRNGGFKIEKHLLH